MAKNIKRKSRKAKVYCGNNRNARKGKPVGSRSQCLKVGIGKGRSLKCETSYGGPYDPIDDRKLYCGDQKIMPSGYDILGSPSLCLKTGIGLGKSLRARQGCGKKKSGKPKKSRKKKSRKAKKPQKKKSRKAKKPQKKKSKKPQKKKSKKLKFRSRRKFRMKKMDEYEEDRINRSIGKYAAILMEEYNKDRLTESTRSSYEYYIELPASRGDLVSAKDIATVWIYYLKDMVVGNSDFKLYEEFVPLDISFDYRLLFETSMWFPGLRFSDVIREHYETDAALLKKIILTARSEYGNSLLLWQIANARPDTAKILLENFYDKEEALTKQNLEIQDDINKNNVLHLLIAKGYYKHSGEAIQFHKQDLDWLEFPIPYLPKTEDESSLLKMILDADKDNVLNTQKNKFGLTPMLIAYLRAEPVVIAIMENKYGKVNIDEMISQESDEAKKKILKLVKASYTKYYLRRQVSTWFMQSKIKKLLTAITSFEGSPYMHVWSP